MTAIETWKDEGGLNVIEVVRRNPVRTTYEWRVINGVRLRLLHEDWCDTARAAEMFTSLGLRKVGE